VTRGLKQWGLGSLGVLFSVCSAAAQVTPANPYPPPDDTPSIRVGGTLFADYTYTLAPETTDADGNLVNPNAFSVVRAYINVSGQVNHLFSFRITPDLSRESGTGSSLAGSMVFRLKYGFAQLNLDDWMWRGSFVHGGMIPTPYVEFEESIYRYRFQGPVFVDRETFLPSADLGAAFRTQFPGGYGEAVVGVYNGEGYTRADPNDQKALQVRGTVRPLPAPGPVRGLRTTLFYDADHYVKNAERERIVSMVSYEHRFVNAAWVHLEARDQLSSAAPSVDSRGDSFWVTPRLALGELQPATPAGTVRASLEGLFRYDRLEANQADDNVKTRVIAGIAYWPRVTVSSVGAAFLLDFERVRYSEFTPARPTERRITLHMLLRF
jgi:hypothetical protein